MNNKLRAKASKKLAQSLKNLNYTKEKSKNIMSCMDKEAIEQRKLFEECASEMD